MSNSSPLIKVENVCVRYPNQDINILNYVNFTIQPNEAILLVGSSGSGKSTLTLCLNGLIPKRIPCDFSGKIEVAGQDINNLSLSEISQKIGMVFQNPESQMLIAETVEEEVAFGLEMLQIKRDKMEPLITQSLEQVGLLEKRKEKTQHLSLGQKQKLALAAVLAVCPQILILDEPSAALDPESTQHLFQILQMLKEQKNLTLILIEHKLDRVLPWIDHVFLLSNDGSLVEQEIQDKNQNRTCEFFLQNQVLLEQEGVFVYPSLQVKQENKRNFLEGSHEGIPKNDIEYIAKDIIKSEISIVHLSASFESKPILHDINLTLEKGKLITLLGGNGAGKTTLTRHLINDIVSPKGTIFLQGRDIRKIPQIELVQKMGYVFQNPEHQFLEDTVFTELMLGFRLKKMEETSAKEQSLILLKQWGLLDQQNAHPFTLSQGQKRRLSLLTMLYLGQEILILDEPTWGMDQNNISLFSKELLSLKEQGKTIILITHDMDLVKRYADQSIVLHQGSVLFQGSPSELFQNSEILRKSHLGFPKGSL